MMAKEEKKRNVIANVKTAIQKLHSNAQNMSLGYRRWKKNKNAIKKIEIKRKIMNAKVAIKNRLIIR